MTSDRCVSNASSRLWLLSIFLCIAVSLVWNSPSSAATLVSIFLGGIRCSRQKFPITGYLLANLAGRTSLIRTNTENRALENESLKLGSLVAGAVEHITPHAVIVGIDASSHMKGTISLEHLADHHDISTTLYYGLPAQLMSVMKPGYHFDELLVLDIEGNNIGYICNIIETGCFVRFIGHLTGFAPKARLLMTKDRIFLRSSMLDNLFAAT
ncbi:hypothetical protein OROGR_013890 [Orobanche gracilis]